jgi:GNAT superfamily N-acetyltransferase
MKIEATVHSDASVTPRARQLRGMFDVPDAPHQERSWSIDAPVEERDWSVGLIVGPSGSGKSTLLREFGEPRGFEWSDRSVIDDFAPELPLGEVTAACSAVGFNTIPAWLRPFGTLSNGEQFRVTLARLIAECSVEQSRPLVVIDEFTSVVDRQVAKIASHALAKYARRRGVRVVAASCHYDVIDWLQPDWILEPGSGSFSWRSVQPRPTIDIDIAACEYSVWGVFAPFHYLTAELNRSARTFAAYVDGHPVAFAGVLHRPSSKPSRTGQNLKGLSRLVTLPDWQGLGIAFVLAEAVAGAYAAVGCRFHTYPAHPALIRSFDRSPRWAMLARPGFAGSQRGGTDVGRRAVGRASGSANVHGVPGGWVAGGRPCATFRYVGPALDLGAARELLSVYHDC